MRRLDGGRGGKRHHIGGGVERQPARRRVNHRRAQPVRRGQSHQRQVPAPIRRQNRRRRAGIAAAGQCHRIRTDAQPQPGHPHRQHAVRRRQPVPGKLVNIAPLRYSVAARTDVLVISARRDSNGVSADSDQRASANV